MRRFALIPLGLATAVAVAAPVPKKRAKPVELLDAAGDVLVAADEITGYEWETHALFLNEAAERRLIGLKNPSFAVAVGGEVVYRVELRSAEGCTVVGRPHAHKLDEPTPTGRVTIEFFAGSREPEPDPRADERVRAALEKAGKLK